MKPVLSFIDRCSGGSGFLAALIVLPLIFATVYEVVSRYVFNAPTIWAYELGYMATGANFLLGAAFTLRERGHIRIDILYQIFTPKTRALVDVAGYTFLMLPVCLWLSYRLGFYAWEAFESGERSGESAWNPIVWPYRMVFFFGITTLTLQGIAQWCRALMVLFAKQDDASEISYDG